MCPCNSGLKAKHCHLRPRDTVEAVESRNEEMTADGVLIPAGSLAQEYADNVRELLDERGTKLSVVLDNCAERLVEPPTEEPADRRIDEQELRKVN